MKPFIFVILSILLAVVLVGCASTQGAGDAYKAFQEQDDEIDLLNITFTEYGGSLTVSGVTGIRMQAQKKIKAAMPADPNTAAQVVSGIKDMVLGGVGIYTLGQVASKDPTVIQQPAPVVAQPSYAPTQN